MEPSYLGILYSILINPLQGGVSMLKEDIPEEYKCVLANVALNPDTKPSFMMNQIISSDWPEQYKEAAHTILYYALKL